LGWNKFTADEFKIAQNFIDLAEILPLTTNIKDTAIEIRQKYNLKLGDAIIAATALCNDSILVTRNTKDFDLVVDLKVYNPFAKAN